MKNRWTYISVNDSFWAIVLQLHTFVDQYARSTSQLRSLHQIKDIYLKCQLEASLSVWSGKLGASSRETGQWSLPQKPENTVKINRNHMLHLHILFLGKSFTFVFLFYILFYDMVSKKKSAPQNPVAYNKLCLLLVISSVTFTKWIISIMG